LFKHGAEKVFPCPATEAIGTSIDRFLTEGLRQALEGSMASFDGGGKRPYVWAPGGLSARRADGGEFPIEATLSHGEVGGRELYTLILPAERFSGARAAAARASRGHPPPRAL